jgi:hypothetical protein
MRVKAPRFPSIALPAVQHRSHMPQAVTLVSTVYTDIDGTAFLCHYRPRFVSAPLPIIAWQEILVQLLNHVYNYISIKVYGFQPGKESHHIASCS